MKTYKLYDVERNSYVRVIPQEDEYGIRESVKVPPAAPQIKKGELIYFSHIDGMYSLCQKVNEETMEHGEICHIAAWTEVEIVELDDLFNFEQIRELIGRAGYGKDGKGEYREAKLKDMNDNWVKASIDFVDPTHPHRVYYIKELQYRKENDISIPDTEE